MADARNTARRSKGEATRARILAAARRLLIREGYDALVMRTLAGEVGVTLGNLQYYFPTREVLLEAVVRNEAASDLADLRVDVEANVEPRTELADLVRRLVTKWRGESGRITALLGFLALHQPAFRQIYVDVYERFYGALADVIRRLEPDVSGEEADRRARMITALIDGAAMQVGRGGPAAFLEDVVEAAQGLAMGWTASRGSQEV